MLMAIKINSQFLKEINETINVMKTISIDGWYNFAAAEGSGLRKTFTIFNPTGSHPEVNITKCRLYSGGTWYDIDVDNIVSSYVSKTSITLYINSSSVFIASINNNYLIELFGTIKCA